MAANARFDEWETNTQRIAILNAILIIVYNSQGPAQVVAIQQNRSIKRHLRRLNLPANGDVVHVRENGIQRTRRGSVGKRVNGRS